MNLQLINTMGTSRPIEGIYEPESLEELIEIFTYLKSKDISISVNSTGNNWGYGCNCPVEDDRAVISLKRLNNIIEFDVYHGLVTLQPGVTYGQLANYLKEHGDAWITPVHGGGPNCSITGNALERGYGLTPDTDHFGAINSLEAILNDGSIYKGALEELGQPRLNKLFRNGIGPYFDGLFTQSGVGIVTSVTLKLARKSDYIEMFYFNIPNDESLEDIVQITKELKVTLGSTLGGINLINQERYLSMSTDYPIEKLRNGLPLSIDEISLFSKKYLATPWLVLGALYGEKSMVVEAKKIIKKRFSKTKSRSFFYNSSNRNIFLKLAKAVPRIFGIEIQQMVSKLDEAYRILNGEPSSVALKLAYWKNENKQLVNNDELNPSQDNCGIIWYAPLVELKPEVVRSYVEFINEASLKFNMNSLITLTTVDDLCFDSTVPILFNKNNEQEVKNAWNYYNYLISEGAKRGFFPYRLNVDTQKKFIISNKFLLPDSVVTDRYR